jgi:hypothetical protein
LLLTVTVAGRIDRPAQAQGFTAAVAGDPFGVAQLDVTLPPDSQNGADQGLAVTVREKGNRVFYPAVGKPVLSAVGGMLSQARRPLPRLLGGILGSVAPQTSIYFLFRGTAPLEITVKGQPPITLPVGATVDPAAYRQMIAAWWQAYTAQPGLLEKKPDYPPMVENYLQAMLARRLGLRLPEAGTGSDWQSQFEQQFGLTISTETIRLQLQRDRMLGQTALAETANQPLPPPIVPPDLILPEPPADVAIEPIALRVPEECLYVRFGTFTNFLWFQDTLARWGGDLRNLVGQRGIDQGQNARFQRQIVLQTTALARLFGEATVADAAIVAGDLSMGEGAGMGILFYARNNLLLSNDLSGQRSDVLKANPRVKETKVKLVGHDVLFLSAPDNSVRAFYATDGDYHFVTNSQTLARRFLETASGQRALGKSKEFRFARSVMPIARDDTAFIYLSDAFLRKLVSPQYRVETVRRLQAAADLDLVQLAKVTAAGAGEPGGTIAELMVGGFLPAEFGARPDGSLTQWSADGAYDSLRGARGTFLPLEDVEVAGVTPSEAAAYLRFADYYTTKWGRIDPIMAGLQRKTLPGGKREHVAIDLRMAPLNRGLYNVLSNFVGPADDQRLAPVAGDILAGEMMFPRQRVFLGLRDFGGLPEDVMLPGLLETLGVLPFGRLSDLLYGYLGTTGEGIGLLRLVDQLFAMAGPPDVAGYSHAGNNLWRRQIEHFVVYSLHQDILAQVTGQLHMEHAERPGQVRFHVADLSQAHVAPMANRWLYSRSVQTTQGNLRLLQSMTAQLHVPGEDALSAVELLLGAKLVDPLRGKYVYRTADQGSGYWTSTALEAQPATDSAGKPVLPDGFQAPPLNWFRGMQADVLLQEERISAHGEVDMQITAP